jgi:hypothetical protein
MSELVGLPVKQAAAETPNGPPRRAGGRVALELVAMRGKDVVGVRHLREGGAAWIGDTPETLVRMSMREHGGQPFIVGDVRAGTHAVHVPPRARARVHPSSGVPRLLSGPQRVELQEGERAVVVLGAIQIRAAVVPFEVQAPRFKITAGAAALALVLAAVYAAAIALTAAMVEPPPARLTPGALQRIEQRVRPPLPPAARRD